MDIKSLKLVTGEEIICELIKKDVTGYVIKNPLAMVFNGQSVQGVPFTFTVDDGEHISIFPDKVVFIATPRQQMIDQYKQQFSSILTPSKGILVGK